MQLAIVLLPMVFFFVEFVIDQIYFPTQLWWYCFITSAVAAGNVTVDFIRS